MSALTRKQAECLAFIVKYQELNGCRPTYREIAAGLGMVSPQTPHRRVRELISLGVLRKQGQNFHVVERKGARFHLAKILEVVEQDGIIGLTSPLVAEAREFMGRAV